jgi:hypothetical protein
MPCDFCQENTGPGKRGYRARRSIEIVTPVLNWCDGGGEWVACADCATLIEAKDWRGLMQRAIDRKFGIPNASEIPVELIQFIANVWSAIFDQPPSTFLFHTA